MSRSHAHLLKRAALEVGKLARIALANGKLPDYFRLVALRRELYQAVRV